MNVTSTTEENRKLSIPAKNCDCEIGTSEESVTIHRTSESPLVGREPQTKSSGKDMIEGAEEVTGKAVMADDGRRELGARDTREIDRVSPFGTCEKAKRTILVLHEDIIGDSFWENYPHIISN